MRRLVGKSDTLDAENAARAVLAGFATAEPKTADGTVEMIRQLKVAHDTAVKDRSAAMIKDLVTRTAPQLVEPFGIGVDTAAEILIVVGDNPGRIRSEAALAKLAGISPIPASSGMTSGRHRINHGGYRQLNAAIYRTVIVRMRFHQPTIDYVTRRTAEGLSKRDIIRCLKRYVIREVYHLVVPAKNVPQITS